MADSENADGDPGDGLQDQVGATAGIDDSIDQGLVILKQLDAIMHDKYAHNPEKLAAWLTASRSRRPSANAKQPAPAAGGTQAVKAVARRVLTIRATGQDSARHARSHAV